MQPQNAPRNLIPGCKYKYMNTADTNDAHLVKPIVPRGTAHTADIKETDSHSRLQHDLFDLQQECKSSPNRSVKKRETIELRTSCLQRVRQSAGQRKADLYNPVRD